jgi:hypothetical protein
MIRVLNELCWPNVKRLIDLTLLAVALGGGQVVSSAAAYNGDLIIGFTAGSGNDLIYDLGPFSGFTNGQTWNVSSLLSGYELAILHWGIVGNTLNGIAASADNTVYTTTTSSAVMAKPLNQSGYNAVYGQVRSMYGLFPAAGTGQYISIAITPPNSWYSQTFSPTLPTQYKNAYEDPNVYGISSAVLWGVDTQGGATKLLGSFSLATNGVVTFTPGMAPSQPPPPPVLSIARSGSITTISFGSTNGATYTLHYTNSYGLNSSVSTWPVSPSTVTGDGSMKSFTDTSTDADRFYRVSAR